MDLNESIEWIRQQAGQARYMNEVWLNVQLSTWQAGMGLSPQQGHTLDLAVTTQKYRAMGVIK